MPSRVRRFPISVRIHLTTVVALLGLLTLAAVQANGRAAQLQADRIALLRGVVESAAGIAGRYEAEERAGRLPRAEAQRLALDAVRGIRYRGQEYVWVNDMAPRIVMHPFRPDLDGKDLAEFKDPTGFRLFVAFADAVRRDGSGVVGYPWPRPGAAQAGQEPVEKLSYVQGFAPWGWVIGSGVYVDDLRAAQRSMMWRSLGAAGATAAMVALLAWLVARGITRPLAAATRATAAMAAGDLDAPVPGAERGDELGVLARALEAFRAQGLEKRRLEAAAAADRDSQNRRYQAMDRLTQDFGTTVSGVLAKLGSSAEEMRGAAGQMTDAAERTREDMASTARDAETSSQSLVTVAAATEELTASVGEIAHQVARAAESARAAAEQARGTDATVRGLSEAAGDISEVIRLISDIAGQTNLLALNATIEAARAGEAGKGFAVVANEVKALAAQTAQATSRIATQVAAIQGATGEAVQAVARVAEAINSADEVAAGIAAAVEEQGAATREIAGQVQNVARATDDATRAMRNASTAAQDTQATSRTVLASAGQVAGVSGTLRDEVDRFLAAIRGSQQNGGAAAAGASPAGAPALRHGVGAAIPARP